MSAVNAMLDDYQRFTPTTAKYPRALALPYLALGIGDEAGELLEKCLDHSALVAAWGKRELLPEAGDVMWYMAQLLLEYEVTLSEVYQRAERTIVDFEATLDGLGTYISIHAAKLQGRIKKHLRDQADVREAVIELCARIVRALMTLCRIFDSSLFLVMDDNRRKLEARLEANTIQGEGDHR